MATMTESNKRAACCVADSGPFKGVPNGLDALSEQVLLPRLGPAAGF